MAAVTVTDLNNAALDVLHIKEVATNPSGTSTDRLGHSKKVVAQVIADMEAAFDDTESTLNTYKEEAQEARDAIDNRIYPGSYASDPALRPDGTACQVGDKYFSSADNLTRTYNGATWVASDISTANLAASTGSSLVGHKAKVAGAVPTTLQAAAQRWFRASDSGLTDTGGSVALSPIVGAIRNNGAAANAYDYWKLITTSGHTPVGFRNADGVSGHEVETTSSYIRVHHTIGGDTTAGVIAVLDETLAQTGLRLGTSVGESYTDIWLYREIEGLVSLSSGGVWNVAYSNGIKTISWDSVNKYLVLTHDDVVNAAILVTPQGSGSVGVWQAQATQIDKNTTRVYFTRSQGLVHSGRVAWNGSAYATVGNAQNLTVTSYNSTTGDLVLGCTNGNLFAYDVALVPYATGAFRAVLKTHDSTSITVNLYDSSGTLVTGSPTTACAFGVRAQSRVQAEQPDNSTNWALAWNSRSQVNPQAAVPVADFPNGNIWLLGHTGKA